MTTAAAESATAQGDSSARAHADDDSLVTPGRAAIQAGKVRANASLFNVETEAGIQSHSPSCPSGCYTNNLATSPLVLTSASVHPRSLSRANSTVIASSLLLEKDRWQPSNATHAEERVRKAHEPNGHAPVANGAARQAFTRVERDNVLQRDGGRHVIVPDRAFTIGTLPSGMFPMVPLGDDSGGDSSSGEEESSSEDDSGRMAGVPRSLLPPRRMVRAKTLAFPALPGVAGTMPPSAATAVTRGASIRPSNAPSRQGSGRGSRALAAFLDSPAQSAGAKTESRGRTPGASVSILSPATVQSAKPAAGGAGTWPIGEAESTAAQMWTAASSASATAAEKPKEDSAFAAAAAASAQPVDQPPPPEPSPASPAKRDTAGESRAAASSWLAADGNTRHGCAAPTTSTTDGDGWPGARAPTTSTTDGDAHAASCAPTMSTTDGGAWSGAGAASGSSTGGDARCARCAAGAPVTSSCAGAAAEWGGSTAGVAAAGELSSSDAPAAAEGRAAATDGASAQRARPPDGVAVAELRAHSSGAGPDPPTVAGAEAEQGARGAEPQSPRLRPQSSPVRRLPAGSVSREGSASTGWMFERHRSFDTVNGHARTGGPTPPRAAAAAQPHEAAARATASAKAVGAEAEHAAELSSRVDAEPAGSFARCGLCAMSVRVELARRLRAVAEWVDPPGGPVALGLEAPQRGPNGGAAKAGGIRAMNTSAAPRTTMPQL